MKSETKVYLTCRKEFVGVGSLDIINIEENLTTDEDMITFICPYCNQEHKSKVYSC